MPFVSTERKSVVLEQKSIYFTPDDVFEHLEAAFPLSKDDGVLERYYYLPANEALNALHDEPNRHKNSRPRSEPNRSMPYGLHLLHG